MAREVKASEATASRRRVVFQLVETDGITPATGEAGGQPQISVDSGAWTDTGIGTLSAVGHGRYYADLTTGVIGTAGTVIETRYASDNTAECPGDTFIVVVHDPYSDIAAIKAKTSTIGTAPIIVISPLTPDGGVLKLVRGDDYDSSLRVVPTWAEGSASLAWPPSLVGASVYLQIGKVKVLCDILVDTGSSKSVQAEPTRQETMAMPAGPAREEYHLYAIMPDKKKVTLYKGSFIAD